MKRKPQKHLINILKTTKDHHPNFTLFLGAGASISSGIKSAWKMIEEWRVSYAEMHSEELLKSNTWYNQSNEYSELFEALYDQPTQRREFIENCIVNSIPSWGYVYLVNLLKNKAFNTIFTTNFDDLINEACYTFSNNLRPVVCAHDSSIKNIRLTSNRPKIIKLHGDFLFDDIKNTIRELESLEDNMRTKFRQYANEFGMIVVGYAGNDRSIMDTLNTLLHSDNTFPHGIYWCVRKDTIMPEELKNLARFPRFHLIEIEGFDELMAEIHHELGYSLQEEVADPYSALSNKLDRYFTELDDDDEITNPFIKKDMKALADHVLKINQAKEFVNKLHIQMQKYKMDPSDESAKDAIEKMIKEAEFLNDGSDVYIYSTPNAFIANAAFREEDYETAKRYAQRSLELSFTIEALSTLVRSKLKLDKDSDIKADIERFNEFSVLTEKDKARVINVIVDLISYKSFANAKRLLSILEKKNVNERDRSFIILNKSLILKLEGKDLSKDIVDTLNDDLRKAIKTDDYWLSFGLALLIDDEDIALKMAGSLDEQQLISALVQEMPIFTLIQPSLYEKLTNLAKGRGYDVPEEESSDSVIFDNPSYAVEEQSDVETVDMDQLPIASIVSPTDKSGSDETKAVS
ncbi:SIR2 family protein [Klebsiella pneumoniae]|uniref:SIR2 family protein n=1 Tax=Klebsiella pneumoniae TaxID=573 RepID=UPI0027307C6C|nr:SIR2 family protein [Klebsiella pneumoniae]MDP1186558.1 SIR2 family protein [Klebsiella pneumoniae]